MDNKENKKGAEAFKSFMGKTADFGKKVADGIQKSAENISEQNKKKAYENMIKKNPPVSKEVFKSKKFRIPSVIKIVSSNEKKDFEAYEGAIGYTETVEKVEILYMFEEFVKDSKLQFVPFSKLGGAYCMDSFDKTKFVDSESVFDRATNEKLAELEHIACSLGAKSFSVEIVEGNSQGESSSLNAKAGDIIALGSKVSSGNHNMQHGKNTTYFEGHQEPKRPTLKWYESDESIKGLIEMRCSGNNSVKSKILELSGSNAVSTSREVACAIDKISGLKGSVSMEAKSIKEHSSKFIFEIEF